VTGADVPELDELLARLAPPVAALVTAADELIARTDPAVVRVVWPHQRTVGYGIGPKKMSEHYAYIAAYDRHINVGFNYGARIDQEGLLDGTGTSFRKLTVRSLDVLEDPRLERLLRVARRERSEVLGPR
jgi:hypothetical protein